MGVYIYAARVANKTVKSEALGDIKVFKFEYVGKPVSFARSDEGDRINRAIDRKCDRACKTFDDRGLEPEYIALGFKDGEHVYGNNNLSTDVADTELGSGRFPLVGYLKTINGTLTMVPHDIAADEPVEEATPFADSMDALLAS